MSEMTNNEALQELNRFTNVFQAASHLKEALQVAANVESAKNELETERRNLEDKVHRLEALVAERQKETQRAITDCEKELQETLRNMEAERNTRAGEHLQTLEQMQNKHNAALEDLERELATMSREARDMIATLDDEIATKQALVNELNEQLNNLRRRLG